MIQVKALKRAIQERQPGEGPVFHTDRGIEYTGKGFRIELNRHKIKASVNRLKAELIRGRKFKSMEELRYALNSYINHFYNKKRLHSEIG